MVSEENTFYVYVLFKTYKKGNFVYDDLCFLLEPFYVGKGKGRRIYQSSESGKSRNHKKTLILEKIKSLKLTVSHLKYKENLTEDEAFSLEIELINKIGRSDLGKGPLVNRTAGGEGPSGGTSRKGDWPELYVPVLQYNLAGEFIKEYPSIKHAIEENPKSKNVSYCCQLRRDTAGGFIWRYKKSGRIPPKIDTSQIIKRTQKGNFEMPVVQKNLEGEILNHFKSIKEAASKTGCHPSKIVLVCQKKRKKTKEFIFEYCHDN